MTVRWLKVGATAHAFREGQRLSMCDGFPRSKGREGETKAKCRMCVAREYNARGLPTWIPYQASGRMRIRPRPSGATP